MKLIVTGGLGFIGSFVIKNLIKRGNIEILNLDNQSYSANPKFLEFLAGDNNYKFYKGDIADKKLVTQILKQFKPEFIMNLAAESHVDRSISSPDQFIHTNIIGTFNLLECTRHYLIDCSKEIKNNFRFHHISTDEVFGSLGKTGFFKEDSKYNPNSPYSASKASSDHLVRAWNHTFKVPTIITNCSNN